MSFVEAVKYFVESFESHLVYWGINDEAVGVDARNLVVEETSLLRERQDRRFASIR